MRWFSTASVLWVTGISVLIAAFGSDGNAAPATTQRLLYAVNQAPGQRGTISVYDIEADHRLIKTIYTVTNVGDVRGVAAAAATGRLFVSYIDGAGNGRIFSLGLADDKTLWDKAIVPGVDRLAISPDGRRLYVPTWEGREAGYINVLDANTGELVHQVYFSNRSHDAQYPLSGPLFQETKASDGSGAFLYRIDPGSYAITRTGPYSGVLGPYAVDGKSRYVVNDVTSLWGMQVADLKTGRIVTAVLPRHPPGDAGLMHGIGWTPDEIEVWQSSSRGDSNIYIWDMANPLAPVFQRSLKLKSGHGSHWLTFDLKGDYAYVAPEKNSSDGTEIFSVRGHQYIGTIGSSEDMLEIDFVDGKVTQVGDQYGIGRRR
jgi:hypothetical protein